MQHAVPECGGERQKSSGKAAAFSQDGDYPAHFHNITPSGEEDASTTFTLMSNERSNLVNATVSLCSIKCTQCQSKISLWSMWSQRCCVFPLMAASLKTGELTLDTFYTLKLIVLKTLAYSVQ